MSTSIDSAAARLDAWIEAQGFRGWDPYDALNSPLLRRLTFDSRRMGQVWVQLLKRSPLNLRPLLGISKDYNPKAMGLFLASYWRKYLLSGEREHLEQTHNFYRWLVDQAAEGYAGHCWGYNFPWPNRGFFAPTGTPNIVTTAFVGLALLDLLKLKVATENQIDWGDGPLTLARGACDFILQDLNREQPAPNEICFSYTPLDRRFVHNASLLGAHLLAEVGLLTGEEELLATAEQAGNYTARRQQSAGSWRYGQGGVDGWVDNFHTGYVLVSLHRIGEILGSEPFGPAVEYGYRFWKDSFFMPDGAPCYYPDRTYPLDVHSLSQAILTFLAFRNLDPAGYERAEEVAAWGIQNMQAPDGSFHFQHYPHYTIRIPYMRWSQAWMQRAFSEWNWSQRHLPRPEQEFGQPQSKDAISGVVGQGYR